MIWAFWDRIRSQDDPILGAVPEPVWRRDGLALSIGVVIFSVLVATFRASGLTITGAGC